MLWTSNLFTLPSSPSELNKHLQACCLEAGGALGSAHPGPALSQKGAPKHQCAILQMGKLGPETVKEKTTS